MAKHTDDRFDDGHPPIRPPSGGVEWQPPPPRMEGVQMAHTNRGDESNPFGGDRGWPPPPSEQGMRSALTPPDAYSPGPFNPSQEPPLAAKRSDTNRFDPFDPTFIPEGGYQSRVPNPQDHSPGPFNPTADVDTLARLPGQPKPTDYDWQQGALGRPQDHSPGPFNPTMDVDTLARLPGQSKPTDHEWQQGALGRPQDHSPGPFNPTMDVDTLARLPGQSKPTDYDWQQGALGRPQDHSPGPFNPTPEGALARNGEHGQPLPPEVARLAETMKESGKYDAYSREELGNIAAAAFKSAGDKFTPKDVVQVADGKFVAVGGDPKNDATPRTEPIDPKIAAATPASQSLADHKPPQQSNALANAMDLESPAQKPRSM